MKRIFGTTYNIKQRSQARERQQFAIYSSNHSNARIVSRPISTFRTMDHQREHNIKDV